MSQPISGGQRAAKWIALTVATLAFSGCTSPALQPAEPRATHKPSPTNAAPPYTVATEGKPGRLIVTVDQLYTVDQMAQIIQDLQGKYTREDGYYVQINCSRGGTSSVDNRLANGKFAVGPIGAVRTGLESGQYELTPVAGAKCPPDALPAASTGPSAEKVVDAFSAAGLPVRNPRDNSNSNCQDLRCAQLITTDDVSVYQFADRAAADRMTEGMRAFDADGAYQNGLIVLKFWHQDPDQNARYRHVLDKLVG